MKVLPSRFAWKQKFLNYVGISTSYSLFYLACETKKKMLVVLNILDFTDDRIINRVSFANITYKWGDC